MAPPTGSTIEKTFTKGLDTYEVQAILTQLVTRRTACALPHESVYGRKDGPSTPPFFSRSIMRTASATAWKSGSLPW